MRKLIFAAAWATLLSVPAQAVTFRGDMNLDGELNVVDVIRMLNVIVERVPRPVDPCADIDGDGVLSVIDAIRALNMIVGNLTRVPCDACAGPARFLDRGLTVFDCQTGLEWEKKETEAIAVGDRYFWTEVSTEFLPRLDGFAGAPACTNTPDCTSSDGVTVTCATPPPNECWRLPDIDELTTIVDPSVPGCGVCPFGNCTTACIDPVFGPTAIRIFMSATSLDTRPQDVWNISFRSVPPGPFVRGKRDGGHVRAVRNDCAGSARFIDRGSTVFDCKTRLEWEKKTPTNFNDRYTWSDAVAEFLPGLHGFAGVPSCPTTSDCTSSDGVTVTCTTPPATGCWRLPEVDELRTILSAEYPNCSPVPCIDPVFGQVPEEYPGYWSATADAGTAHWFVLFHTGAWGRAGPGTERLVRAVNSGP